METYNFVEEVADATYDSHKKVKSLKFFENAFFILLLLDIIK